MRCRWLAWEWLCDWGCIPTVVMARLEMVELGEVFVVDIAVPPALPIPPTPPPGGG